MGLEQKKGVALVYSVPFDNSANLRSKGGKDFQEELVR